MNRQEERRVGRAWPPESQRELLAVNEVEGMTRQQAADLAPNRRQVFQGVMSRMGAGRGVNRHAGGRVARAGGLRQRRAKQADRATGRRQPQRQIFAVALQPARHVRRQRTLDDQNAQRG